MIIFFVVQFKDMCWIVYMWMIVITLLILINQVPMNCKPETTNMHKNIANICLTKSPAFFTARGRPSSPVPMFPFSRWINVWRKLQAQQSVTLMNCVFIETLQTLKTRLGNWSYDDPVRPPIRSYSLCEREGPEGLSGSSSSSAELSFTRANVGPKSGVKKH